MFHPRERDDAPLAVGPVRFGNAAGARKPVLIILHQLHSSSGHIGQWLRANGYPLDIRRPRFGDRLPATMADHAGAVIFGGPMSANDPDDYIRIETDWIAVPLKEEAPFLGVCLGGQMLARHLGAGVFTDPEETVEIGYKPVHATQEGQAICAWPDQFYQWHREGFDVPAGATVLARAPGAFANQAFVYGRSAVSVQFHPEITYAQVHRWTGYNPERLTLQGAAPRNAQIRDHLTFGPSVARWRDEFLSAWIENRLRPNAPVSGDRARVAP